MAGLEARGISLTFGGLRALNDVSIDFRAGRITAIIGPNGAGKSTLVNVLTGFQEADSGEVYFDERPVSQASPQGRAALGLRRSFQTPRIFTEMSVLENILLADPDIGSGVGRPLMRRRRMHREEAEAVGRAHALLDEFGIVDIAHSLGGEISGGQSRLVEVARLAVARPRFLILDEPTAGVAPAMIDTVVSQLRRLHDETKMSMVLVEHNMGVVEDLAHDVYVMAEGAVLARGRMKELRLDERVIEAYLGSTEV